MTVRDTRNFTGHDEVSADGSGLLGLARRGIEEQHSGVLRHLTPVGGLCVLSGLTGAFNHPRHLFRRHDVLYLLRFSIRSIRAIIC